MNANVYFDDASGVILSVACEVGVVWNFWPVPVIGGVTTISIPIFNSSCYIFTVNV